MVSGGLEDSSHLRSAKSNRIRPKSITTWAHRPLLKRTPNLKIDQSSAKFYYKKSIKVQFKKENAIGFN